MDAKTIAKAVLMMLTLATTALASGPRPSVPFFERDQPAFFNGTYGRWVFRAGSGPSGQDGCVLIEDGTEQQKPWWTRDCKPEIVAWAVAITVIGGLAVCCGCLACCFRAFVANLVRRIVRARQDERNAVPDEEVGETQNMASNDNLTARN